MKTEYRVRFSIDEDARFEECNGEERPLTEEEYAENEYSKDGKPVSYADYLDYYGNPERHVYLVCDVEKKCGCCGHWAHASSLGGIDFMDDNEETDYQYQSRAFTPVEAEKLPNYLRECALDVLDEAGYTLPRHIYCAKPRCKYRHVVGSKYCARHAKGTK